MSSDQSSGLMERIKGALIPKGESDKPDEGKKEDIDRSPERIAELYHEEGLPMSEVGSRLGRSKSWVSMEMSKHNIPVREHAKMYQADWYVQSDHPRHEYLDWLSPVAREDYEQVVLGDESIETQADKRGVKWQAVYYSVRRAADRLDDILEDETNA